MRSTKGYIGLGILLVALGILLLLQTYHLLPDLGGLLWGLLAIAGGLIFLAMFATNRENWWTAIPGFTLLGVGGTILLADRGGNWAGASVLAGIGLGFWAIYLVRRDMWWPIIPGGTLLTLALVAGLSDAIPGDRIGGIFMLGLGVTFLLVYLLSASGARMTWALIPAAILALIGVLLLLGMELFAAAIGPLALIVLGGFMLYRALRARRG